MTRIPTSQRGYTLIELMIVITVLGIAGALVIPAFSQTTSLQVQAAVRTIVADLTVAQSDAIAFQQGRGIQFYPSTTGAIKYVVAEVRGTTFDPTLNKIIDQDLGNKAFGGAVVNATTLTNDRLFFDALGGPVTTAGGSTPSSGGTINLQGSGMKYEIQVEPYTGRLTVVDTSK
jgi:prepilin-type N-terminal cleavage/methylation domain-containing protein